MHIHVYGGWYFACIIHYLLPSEGMTYYCYMACHSSCRGSIPPHLTGTGLGHLPCFGHLMYATSKQKLYEASGASSRALDLFLCRKNGK